MRTLIIARHGNTFRKGETPTRVGARTNLELVEEERGRGIGLYIKKLGLRPTRILAAPLKRTLATAALAAEELGSPCPVVPDDRFIEVDYGPDENKTEEAVQLRLGRLSCKAEGCCPCNFSVEEVLARGQAVIDLWNTQAIVPEGWQVDVERIRRNWQDLADSVAEDECVLCVSSNGTIRFAPVITGDYAGFCATHDIKVPTGGVCVFTSDNGGPWVCREWGVKAFKLV